MQVISDVPDFNQAVATFAAHFGQNIPTVAGDGLTGNPQAQFIAAASQVSVVTKATDVAEVLYAFSGQITDADTLAAARLLAAQAAILPGIQGWGVLQADNRGTKISWAMRRLMGETAPEGTAWPAPADDPPVDVRFKAAAAPAMPAVPAAA